ncbi:MAG: ABC transporter ATP-binding protein [Dehalococcoidia bacterium]
MLELQRVTRRYDAGDLEVLALRDVSLKIADGEYLAIVGPSGSGKSTLLNLIGLLDLPSEGAVILDGLNVGSISDGDRARLRLDAIGFVFQRFHLLSLLTAAENVMLPLEEVGVPFDERYARATALLDQVGLAERVGFLPARLSGGERQRVAICRALANQPRLVLADEPTGELHSEDKAKILALFRRINAEGNTLVVVTHDAETAAAAGRRIEIRDGEIVREVQQ